MLTTILTVFTGVLIIGISAVLFVIALSTLYVSTHAWWDPKTQAATSYTDLLPAPGVSFSLIMPCRHESEMVMRSTLDHLCNQDHPDVEVVISVGHDDPETVAVARKLAAERPEMVRVSVDEGAVKNKPRQLNTALAMCRNDVVGVFDAESIAAPDLLLHVDTCFVAKNADVVQGAVQLVNYRDTWYSLRNCLEYFMWFRSRLHAYAKQGFIPLGGNTVFVRRELLSSINGWDNNCLAEDCDLGVRLSVMNRKIVIAYSPHLVTKEETPDSIRSLVKQRTRWSLGFMQVFAKRDWQALPTLKQRSIAWWTLMQQHFMAFAGLCIPLCILTALFGKFPVPVTLLTFVPLVPAVAAVAFDICMLREFGRDHGYKIRLYDYVRLVLGTPFYQILLAFSALRALIKFRQSDFRWEKTMHAGSHLGYLAARP
ncbi:glycosyltransferase family 2 protein [Pseudarthrobacter phenanthrenivorans]|uniref:Glycosyltransferase family 2 protein n=1 Tax=Pseudarthrobacter phenanthrenivorans TaxID=361575 RepID=A0A3B0FKD7_PSEPS|nr:glycosyltransferase family 2 protein [Pseudarthrobacter phenanthrenivorans]RKO25394.1 glycosyltransferase family 2 protein [Pseudarthrobacter phenanthrenivorans]